MTVQGGTSGSTGRPAAAAAFQTFTQFLRELSSSNAAGRIIVSGGAAAPQVRYVLLDASSKFAAALRPARAVVLASGTLAPLELLTAQLFSPAERARLRVFQCGHVVAPERVLAVGLGVGPRGGAIKLTHGLRGSEAVLDECGAVLLNLCRVVPQGLVAFVPSFAYCEMLRKRCAPLSCIAAGGLDRVLVLPSVPCYNSVCCRGLYTHIDPSSVYVTRCANGSVTSAPHVSGEAQVGGDAARRAAAAPQAAVLGEPGCGRVQRCAQRLPGAH